MKRKIGIVVAICALFFVVKVKAQSPDVIRGYIEKYKDLAIAEMKRTGVPAAIKLAQGIHETGAGTSSLFMKSNNHFGIKCKTNWAGESVSHDDDARGECFRKYNSSEDSYHDHSDFLKNGQRYAFLFQLAATDYEGWAYGLKKAGYATNPKYSQTIIKLIEDYYLEDYTLIAMGEQPLHPQRTDVAINANNSITTSKEVAAEKEVALEDVAIDYPAGVFKKNETKVIYVIKGTSFLSIAQTHDLSLSRLFEFNELPETEAVDQDQLIYLQRKRKTGEAEFHMVKRGETLQSIAQTEAIRLESLLEYNGLTKNQMPAVGETLFLRSKSSVRPKLFAKQ